MSKLYPIGIQNFEDLRKKDYIYVDKTALQVNIISSAVLAVLARVFLYLLSKRISQASVNFLPGWKWINWRRSG